MTGYGKVFKEKTSTEGAECGSTEGAECGSTEGAEYGSTEGVEYAEKGKACTPCGVQANP